MSVILVSYRDTNLYEGGAKMVDVEKLKDIIFRERLSQRQVAQYLGMSDKTFYSRMKKGVFNSDEMYAMVKLLHIDDPKPVFFAEKVS